MLKLNNVSISITIPSIKEDTSGLIHDIKNTINLVRDPKNIEVFSVNQNKSAAINRNECIERSKGKLIIMLDDDMAGFYSGWISDLIEPMICFSQKYCMVTPRLININGGFPGQLGDCSHPVPPSGEKWTVAKHTEKTGLNIIGGSCICFFKDNTIRFDEKYPGATYEDADFCMQFNKKYPNKKIIINNNCQLIHNMESKGRNINGVDIPTINRKYFNEKWSVQI